MNTTDQLDWLVYDKVEGKEIGFRAILDTNGCVVVRPSPMGSMNARLIAAAPAMLQALQRITHPMADDEDLEFALAIINRATGGAL